MKMYISIDSVLAAIAFILFVLAYILVTTHEHKAKEQQALLERTKRDIERTKAQNEATLDRIRKESVVKPAIAKVDFTEDVDYIGVNINVNRIVGRKDG